MILNFFSFITLLYLKANPSSTVVFAPSAECCVTN